MDEHILRCIQETLGPAIKSLLRRLNEAHDERAGQEVAADWERIPESVQNAVQVLVTADLIRAEFDEQGRVFCRFTTLGETLRHDDAALSDLIVPAIPEAANSDFSTVRRESVRPPRPTRHKRKTADEYNVLLRDWLIANKDKKITVESAMEGIRCKSRNTFNKLPAWKAFEGERKKGRKPKAAPKAVSLDANMADVVAEREDGDLLPKLIREQQRDDRSDQNQRRMRARERL